MMRMQKLEIPIRELRIEPAPVVDYLTKRLRHYVREVAGKRGAVVGLSGGIDSTVTAYIAVRALGPDNVTCAILPSSVTPREDLEDASEVISNLGLPEGNVRLIDVEPIVNSIVSALGVRDRVVKGNVTARIRMVILHAEAAMRDALVTGTSDKSELTIGYFTKYGDAGVDVMPLADLYKTQVRQLASYLGVPARIIEKPPSPRLWEDQTAENELGMSYELLDSILYLRFDRWMDPRKVAEALGIELETVLRVDRMVKSSQHKRMMPEVFRVSMRAHGSDWRYPREWV